ncbi:MAG: DUF2281 domain-containing protein [Chloroflexi bacterium]|nr:DUF2281 domain-containing protein [Chloroflexota bacterium]
MSDVEAAVLEKLKELPEDRQREVLAFVEHLLADARVTKPRERRSPVGLWEGLGIHITDEDIEEARREMWGPYMGDHDDE